MDEDSLDYFQENENYYITEESLLDILHNCIIPSLLSIFDNVVKLVLVNLAFGITTSYFKLNQSVFNFFSGITGICLVFCFISGHGRILIISLFLACYLLLRISLHINFNINLYCLIIILVLCQYFVLESDTWMEIRGPVMVFSMKLISLTDDIQNSHVSLPTFSSYFGYVFSGANIMFGPWLSFKEYHFVHSKPTNKNIWWILAVGRAFMSSLVFLIISNCLVNYLIHESSNKWLVAYGEALSFRTSHYFICYLSETSVLAAGYKNHKIWYDPKAWRYIVTAPEDIEAPGALAIVVTSWNRPMHDFLKKYVYKSWVPLGKFYGILATFVISSFLHGFETKVSVVLISIGIFSYTEFLSRDIFARAFDCCIRVYACKEPCRHRYKRNNTVSLFFRTIFSFISIIHLIFLGMIMDQSTNEVGILSKWSDLYYCSIWIIAFNILIIL